MGPLPKKLFGKSFLELQKLHKNKVVYSVQSSLAHLSPKERCVRIFKGLLKKPLKARPLTAVPTHYDKIKTRCTPRFLCALNVEASASNSDTRNFSGKVSCESSKAFAKIEWCIRCEVLLPTFLRKKSRSYTDE